MGPCDDLPAKPELLHWGTMRQARRDLVIRLCRASVNSAIKEHGVMCRLTATAFDENDPSVHTLRDGVLFCTYFYLPPISISSRARELQPLSPISTPVAFQHLWPGSPNGELGYPEGLKTQTFDHTAPILIGFSYWRLVVARSDQIYKERGALECSILTLYTLGHHSRRCIILTLLDFDG
ncbi:hypothetical protein AVEN_119489-1 [Araneus ventricosus]|uniref:Uncharacterized protein n=1 Tax=Araneus ventricosus TaxID=182803 RepID=A0A4Y2UH66_ARAVE|nr:hypothetical protein AVEN_119489-1 [Araneus ventricosus]